MSSFVDKSGMFKDFGFKLIVIESLLDKETSFKEELEKMKEKYIVPYEWNYTFTCIPEMLDFFENLVLTDEDLKMVEELSFDGGNNIYGLLMPEWDGESDEFDILSVDDMVLLPNLKKVIYISMCDESLMSKFEEKGITVI